MVMIITLKVLTDVAGKPDKEGKVKILKRNVQYLKQFESTGILAEQYVNSKGIPSKKWCFVKEGDTYYKVNHRFEDIERLTRHVTIKGFRNG
jgi:hypothetical protein